MNRELSFSEMFRYCLRKWLVIAIIAVVGAASGLLYTVFSAPTNKVVYEGVATLGSMSKFEFDSAGDKEDSSISKYNIIVNRALGVMTMSGIKDAVFNEMRGEIKTVKKLDRDLDAEKLFYESVSVTRGEHYVTVRVAMAGETDGEIALYIKIAERYLQLARDAAKNDSPEIKTDEQLYLSNPTRSWAADAENNSGRGLIMGIVLGLLGGAVLGLLVTVIVYFADRRVKSFADIAAISGNRLLAVCKNNELESVCPRIDAVMSAENKKCLLVTSAGGTNGVLSERFAEYSSLSGRKTLVMRFGGAGADVGLAGYLTGKDADSACEKSSSGVYVMEMKGIDDWVRLLACRERFEQLRAEFDRIILDAEYKADGMLSVLGEIADAYVVGVEQQSVQLSVLYGLADEIGCPQKACGAVIVDPTASYVGKNEGLERLFETNEADI